MNKKIVLGLIIAAVAIILVLVTIFSPNGKFNNNYYNKVAEDFVDAVKSEENMGEFLKKYLNEKALYAYTSEDMYDTETMDDFVELFEKNVKNADVKDVAEGIEGYISGFKGFATYGLKIKLKNADMNESEDYRDFQYLKATYEDDEGEELNFYFDFYKNKLYMISSDGNLDYTYYEENDEYDEGDNESSLTRAEKRKINNRIDQKMINGNKLKGSEVIDLIDEIIKLNEENIDKEIFVGVYITLEDPKVTYDLMFACNDALYNFNNDNAKKAIEEMKKVKSLIDSKEDYYCIESLNKGLVKDISIEIYDGQDDF